MFSLRENEMIRKSIQKNDIHATTYANFLLRLLILFNIDIKTYNIK